MPPLISCSNCASTSINNEGIGLVLCLECDAVTFVDNPISFDALAGFVVRELLARSSSYQPQPPTTCVAKAKPKPQPPNLYTTALLQSAAQSLANASPRHNTSVASSARTSFSQLDVSSDDDREEILSRLYIPTSQFRHENSAASSIDSSPQPSTLPGQNASLSFRVPPGLQQQQAAPRDPSPLSRQNSAKQLLSQESPKRNLLSRQNSFQQQPVTEDAHPKSASLPTPPLPSRSLNVTYPDAVTLQRGGGGGDSVESLMYSALSPSTPPASRAKSTPLGPAAPAQVYALSSKISQTNEYEYLMNNLTSRSLPSSAVATPVLVDAKAKQSLNSAVWATPVVGGTRTVPASAGTANSYEALMSSLALQRRPPIAAGTGAIGHNAQRPPLPASSVTIAQQARMDQPPKKSSSSSVKSSRLSLSSLSPVVEALSPKNEFPTPTTTPPLSRSASEKKLSTPPLSRSNSDPPATPPLQRCASDSPLQLPLSLPPREERGATERKLKVFL